MNKKKGLVGMLNSENIAGYVFIARACEIFSVNLPSMV